MGCISLDFKAVERLDGQKSVEQSIERAVRIRNAINWGRKYERRSQDTGALAGALTGGGQSREQRALREEREAEALEAAPSAQRWRGGALWRRTAYRPTGFSRDSLLVPPRQAC